MRQLLSFLWTMWVLLPAANAGQTCVEDDLNQSVCVTQAQRVLALAPHLTELVDFVGAVNRLVAVDGSSNFPASVNGLPKMPNPWLLGAESILARKPDLVLVWQSGISMDVVAQLRKAGVPVFVSEPRSIQQVASTMRRLATLVGSTDNTGPRVDRWLSDMNALRASYSNRQPVSVFYQVWRQPLMTLGGRHVVSEIISLCGGRNVFDDMQGLAAQVSVEGVLKRNPAVVLASGSPEDHAALVKQWSAWPGLSAVKGAGIHTVQNDVLVRNGPRLLEAASTVCEHIDSSRKKIR